MEVLPAIDLRGGRCVRLVEGDFGAETVYGDDPLFMAEMFAAAGARWIHVVDLDAALTGDPINRPAVASIAAALAGRVRVQTGGGVRSVQDAGQLLDEGVERVVLGTAAFETTGLLSELCERWPGRIAAGIDHRAGEVRLRGWIDGAGLTVDEALRRAEDAGVAAVVVTDIARDGRLSGPDTAGMSNLVRRFEVPVIASGGVSSLVDIEALAAVGSSDGRRLEGVIVGKAIYEGKLDVAEALAAAGCG